MKTIPWTQINIIKDAPFFPEKLDWCSAVGNLILNFGTLDMLTVSFLLKHLDTKDFERCRKLHFKDRLEIVAKCLSRTRPSPTDQKDFKRLQEELEPLRNLRNHVAHGHFNINLIEGVEPRIGLMLPKDIDRPFGGETRNLEFTELRDSLGRLNDAIESFIRISKYGESDSPVSTE